MRGPLEKAELEMGSYNAVSGVQQKLKIRTVPAIRYTDQSVMDDAGISNAYKSPNDQHGESAYKI